MQDFVQFAYENWKSFLFFTFLFPYLSEINKKLNFKSLIKLISYRFFVGSKNANFKLYLKFLTKKVESPRSIREPKNKVEKAWEHATQVEEEIPPYFGTYWFKFKNVWVRADYGISDSGGDSKDSVQESIEFAFLAKDNRIIYDFREEVSLLDKKTRKEFTTVWIPQWSWWEPSTRRRSRPEETLFYANDIHKNILSDLKRFLNNSEEYHKRGRVHKRCYLLYGPAGTGKTTLILWLASQLALDVCLVSENMDSGSFINLVTSRPKNTLLILEDIDALFSSSHQRNTNPAESSSGGQSSAPEKKESANLSLLLNFLDGLLSQEGQIVFLTTNHIDKLDSALIRKGRVDRHVLLRNPNEKCIRSAWEFNFPEKSPEEFLKAYKKLGKKAPMSAFEELFDRFSAEEAVKNVHELFAEKEDDDVSSFP